MCTSSIMYFLNIQRKLFCLGNVGTSPVVSETNYILLYPKGTIFCCRKCGNTSRCIRKELYSVVGNVGTRIVVSERNSSVMDKSTVLHKATAHKVNFARFFSKIQFINFLYVVYGFWNFFSCPLKKVIFVHYTYIFKIHK